MANESLEWIRTQMPTEVMFLDYPLISHAVVGDVEVYFKEGEGPQRVVVQGSDEARRIAYDMANIKYRRNLPYGGCLTRRATEWEK